MSRTGLLRIGSRLCRMSTSQAKQPSQNGTAHSFSSSASISKSSGGSGSRGNDEASSSREPGYRVLTQKTINPFVIDAEYAVRGAIPLRAEELKERLENGEQLPFENVINCNIGNPQQLDQKPLTFLRQVASLTEYPDLLENEHASKIYPKDALERARSLLKDVGNIGAYSHSMGVPAIRKRVAQFIEKRDGFPSDSGKVYLTAGASPGVSNLMQILISSREDGVLIPIPQYPLYTAALALNGARAVPYYLDESAAWGLDVEDLRQSIKKARSEGTNLKALVVINPGNPTGSCLSLENMNDIIKICYDEKLVLFADEVYQTNIYGVDRHFISFKKALRSIGAPYADEVELVSFHSVSKGQSGECGRRGGYFELCNFSPEAEEQVYKLASVQLCPPIQGQIAVDILIANPPKEGDESFPLWKKEVDGISAELKKRSEILHKAFNELEGISCNDAEGAMYLFPTISLPQKAIEAAEEAGQKPDAFYALKMLEATGICVVPGSGFGQVPGSWHFRTTFLAPGVEDYVNRLKKFHEDFMKEHKD